MSYDETIYYKLKKPRVGNDYGLWGGNLNDTIDDIDDILYRSNRKNFNLFLPSLVAGDYFGDFYKIANAQLLTSTPITISLGASKLIFEVTEAGAITIEGKSLKQNTLNAITDSEEIAFSEAGYFISNKHWTEDIEITSSGAGDITVNIYTYKGFSLDKTIKLNKIIFTGICDILNNQIDPDLLIFSYIGNKINIETITDLRIDKLQSSGSRFLWNKEFSISKDILRDKYEFLVRLDSPSLSSWSNVYFGLNWE